MKGYKALNQDMCAIHGNGMQYELNKEYTLDGELKVCKNGFHFCEDLINVYIIYDDIENTRVFEIDTLDGKIIDESNKKCSNKIKLIRELSKEEIRQILKNYADKYIIDNRNYNISEKIILCKFSIYLDILINDESWSVRSEVAKQGYGLDTLINDESWIVRLAVAEQGYGLDKLINDEDRYVRLAVAEQGYGLDKLINDENLYVRIIASENL